MSAVPKNAVQPSTKLPAETWLALAAVVGLVWVWWPTLADTASRWGDQSQYSHGFLVPPFAMILLWLRRDMLRKKPGRPAALWGMGFLLAGLGLRFLGTYVYFEWLSMASLLPCLAGICLLWGGWKAFHWAWPAIVFLMFMVPLPHRVEVGLAHPLQRVATLASTFVLQTMGFAAFSEGNIIRIGEEVRIGVVEACSGLSMLMIFFALSTAVVLLAARTPLEKGLIFISALPIALAANITRIVVATLLHLYVGADFANYF
ncbi:MAG TPA: exosortase/archaeosortase family protein, partial [Gemmataceae bacterium]|nr:exosortase/archaeosortase family protein [Gemmataceae bacterium]